MSNPHFAMFAEERARFIKCPRRDILHTLLGYQNFVLVFVLVSELLGRWSSSAPKKHEY